MRFIHSLRMDWMLPGVLPTGREVECLVVGIVGFKDEKLVFEHIYWDQGTVLSQLGILDTPSVAAGNSSTARLSDLVAQRDAS